MHTPNPKVEILVCIKVVAHKFTFRDLNAAAAPEFVYGVLRASKTLLPMYTVEGKSALQTSKLCREYLEGQRIHSYPYVV
jgi:hypothetical protein